MAIAQKIAYNVIFSGLAKALTIALALFAIGLLARYLGPEGFGKYAIALAYFGFFMALGDLGLHAIATREISRKGADEQTIISKIFTLRLCVSLIVFVLLTLFVWFLPYESEVQKAIFIIGAAFVFSSSYSLLNGVFQKHLAMDRVAISEFTGKLVQMGIIVLLVRNDWGFIASIFAILSAMIVNFLLIFYFSRTFVKIRLSFDPAYWKNFLKESLPMGISAMATFLYFKVDTILLSTLTTTEDVGIYGAAYKIIETLVFFPAMIVGLIFPLLSRYIFTDKQKFLTAANTTLKLFALILIPLIVSVQFLSEDIMLLVGGNEFVASGPVLATLIFALAGIFFGHLFINIAIAANLQKKLMYLLIIAAIFNITANMIFIPLYTYMGSAFVSVATELLVACGALTLVMRNTDYRPRLASLASFGATILILCGVYMILDLHWMLSGLIAMAVYATMVFVLKIVTLSDIRNIKPSTKAVQLD